MNAALKQEPNHAEQNAAGWYGSMTTARLAAEMLLGALLLLG